ncbi:MAG: GAF domain-containing sensor histidine kinase [Chloroflexi bacterium]|nr:GAF domain-containing sensor histidine kinase [Chloroflexota bacterium]
MNLNRLLALTILVPSAFVAGIIVLSYFPHQAGLLDHSQEHLLLALVMVAGIIPFSLFVFRVFRRIERHIVEQNQRLAQRTREMEALLQVGRAAEESLELDRVLPHALEAVVGSTSAEEAEVWLMAERDGSLELRHHQGQFREAFLEISRFRLGEGLPGLVAQTGEPVLIHNAHQDPRFLRQKVKALGFHTFCALPLRRAGRVVGVLAVAARDPKAFATQDEVRLLELMAEHIAVAVENATLHEQVRTLAILTERERIAREMHDGLAQVLGYVNTKAQAVKELLQAGQMEAATQHLEQLDASARETYADVREAILALRSDTRDRPLVDSLREYVQRFGDLSGVPTALVVEGEPTPFPPEIEVQLLRIVQEALTNVRKHARARRADIAFSFQDGNCRLVVADDGHGFDPSHLTRGPWPHLGLQSMRERAAAIGATFTLDTGPGRGTRVVLDIPFSTGRKRP